MKWLVLIMIVLADVDVSAQPIITTQIVVLKYQTQTDTLKIPVVNDNYPALKKALFYKNIFDGDDLPDVIKNYASCGCGVTRLEYDITYQSGDIISLMLYYQTSAAYPDNSQKLLTYKISTGQPYPLTNELNEKGLSWIFENYKALLSKRSRDMKDDQDTTGKDALSEVKTSIDSLGKDELFGSYVFTKAGILFSTEKFLPHVIQNFEPDHDWLIPYKKLQAFRSPQAIMPKQNF